MAIVSISVDDKILKELDRLQKAMGFKGRSEIIRSGIKMFTDEERQKNHMTGEHSAVLLVVHGNKFDDRVAGITHKCEDLIKTHLHNRINDDKCVDMFLLNGDARRMRSMVDGFVTDKKMDTTKLIIL